MGTFGRTRFAIILISLSLVVLALIVLVGGASALTGTYDVLALVGHVALGYPVLSLLGKILWQSQSKDDSQRSLSIVCMVVGLILILTGQNFLAGLCYVAGEVAFLRFLAQFAVQLSEQRTARPAKYALRCLALAFVSLPVGVVVGLFGHGSNLLWCVPGALAFLAAVGCYLRCLGTIREAMGRGPAQTVAGF